MVDWDRVYHQVVNDNWTLLAAFAWKSYAELGRGAVLVQVDQMMRAAPGTDELDVQVTYLPDGEMARLTADTTDLIRGYDPDSEVVILFTGLDPGGRPVNSRSDRPLYRDRLAGTAHRACPRD